MIFGRNADNDIKIASCKEGIKITRQRMLTFIYYDRTDTSGAVLSEIRVQVQARISRSYTYLGSDGVGALLWARVEVMIKQ